MFRFFLRGRLYRESLVFVVGFVLVFESCFVVFQLGNDGVQQGIGFVVSVDIGFLVVAFVREQSRVGQEFLELFYSQRFFRFFFWLFFVFLQLLDLQFYLKVYFDYICFSFFVFYKCYFNKFLVFLIFFGRFFFRIFKLLQFVDERKEYLNRVLFSVG